MITMKKPVEEMSRDEKLERLGLKPRRDAKLNPGISCFDICRQFELRTGVKMSRPEAVKSPEPVRSPPPVVKSPDIPMEPAAVEEPPAEVNIFEIPNAGFEAFPPGCVAKDFDRPKIKSFIQGRLKFQNYANVEDVPQPDREAYTEYKVKLRLRDLQEGEMRGYYQRLATQRGPLDYSLTSSAHPIYSDILKFDKEWKRVQSKNREKLKSRYRVKKTFGLEVSDYKDLPEEHKTGSHVGCAIALMTKNTLKPLQNGDKAARVETGNKAMNAIKPHTPAGKLPGTDIIARRPLIFNDENVKNICIEYGCKISMSFSTLKHLFQILGNEKGQFSMPLQISPTEDWCANERVNLLAIGKKLPEREDIDRSITNRYYKRQLRTIAMGNQSDPEELKLTDQAGKIYPDTGEEDFGRLTRDDGYFDKMPPGQPTCYSIVQIGSQKILVRFPADGISEKEQKICKIVPKLEYQIHFGGEVMMNTEMITEWVWSKFLNVSVRRPRVQVQTGQVFLEEVFETDNWKKMEQNIIRTVGSNIFEQITKKVSYVLQKLGELATRHEGEKKSFLMEYDGDSKVMKIFEEDEEGDRNLLKDAKGEFENVSNVHFDPEHPYWKSHLYWLNVDKDLFMPYHVARNVLPYMYPPKPTPPNQNRKSIGRGGRGGGRGGRGRGGRGRFKR